MPADNDHGMPRILRRRPPASSKQPTCKCGYNPEWDCQGRGERPACDVVVTPPERGKSDVDR